MPTLIGVPRIGKSQIATAIAWIDDAHDASSVRWAADCPSPTRLVATDPPVGLTDAPVATLLPLGRPRLN
jgi:hypothetical protein